MSTWSACHWCNLVINVSMCVGPLSVIILFLCAICNHAILCHSPTCGQFGNCLPIVSWLGSSGSRVRGSFQTLNAWNKLLYCCFCVAKPVIILFTEFKKMQMVSIFRWFSLSKSSNHSHRGTLKHIIVL